MNPGVIALEQLVQMGLFRKGSLPLGGAVQYFACGRPTARQWQEASGLVYKASKWTGTRGLSVACGRMAYDVVYRYDPAEDADSVRP